ncbi:MAG: hypothetical protein ACTHM7_00010 [Ginsengibacter sp.]
MSKRGSVYVRKREQHPIVSQQRANKLVSFSKKTGSSPLSNPKYLAIPQRDGSAKYVGNA